MSVYDAPIQAPAKRYLGDGAYVEFDGFQVLLTTEDGIRVTNTVALDPDVWRSLKLWGKELDEFVREFRRRESRDAGVVNPDEQAPEAAAAPASQTPEEAMRESLKESHIPEHLHGGLMRYVLQGIRPGDFLCACIACDGIDAMNRAADEATKRSIPNITTWLLTECPHDCAGDRKKLEDWVARKRVERATIKTSATDEASGD